VEVPDELFFTETDTPANDLLSASETFIFISFCALENKDVNKKTISINFFTG
jgi:hypothetical protein